MSRGRFELGVGRGVSSIEVGFYGADPVKGPKQLAEVLEIIRKGLTSDILTYKGEFYQIDKVPWL
jgi:alkanesulfonate monooxygenase SsuD/methylene tetrahydromethanopterin reductase-like flavin-dependent oxidoreductase (luciferase family)